MSSFGGMLDIFADVDLIAIVYGGLRFDEILKMIQSLNYLEEFILHYSLPEGDWFSGLRLLTVLPACHISLSANSFNSTSSFSL